MRRRTLLLLLPALLAGCGGDNGGGVGCPAVYLIEPVAAFAGHYTATFTPKGATAATRTLDLNVAADGTVSGTSRDEDAISVLGRFSRVGNEVAGCDRSRMVFSLNTNTDASAGEALQASRDRQSTLVGSYPATLGGPETVTGTLTVDTAPLPG